MCRAAYLLVCAAPWAWAEPPVLPPAHFGKFVPPTLAIAAVIRESRNELHVSEAQAGIAVFSRRQKLSVTFLEAPPIPKESPYLLDPDSPAMQAQFEAARNRLLPTVGGIRLRPRGIRALALQYETSGGGQLQLEVRKTALGERLTLQYKFSY